MPFSDPALWMALNLIMLGEGVSDGIGAVRKRDNMSRLIASVTCSFATTGFLANLATWMGWWPA